MTEAAVRAVAGAAAFPKVWEQVTRLRERGYEPRVFLDEKGDVGIDVSVVLSEGGDDEREGPQDEPQRVSGAFEVSP